MNEHFISYLWKNRYFNPEIETETGENLVVTHPGDQNTDSGPDFFNARLRIGDTTWAGNVEIHVQASDWFKHGHHLDLAYDHVILHVVYCADRQVYHQNGEPVQTVVIENQFPARIFERYRQMMLNEQWIPCMNQLQPSLDYGFSLWAPALTTERMENKTSAISHLLTGSGDDWDEAFYRHLATAFGFKINSLPFEMLAKSLPLKIVRRHRESIVHLEALLYGQAGMLDRDFSDQYPCLLASEYDFFRGKYGLKPIPGSSWKFLRMRPYNFPTIRISQFAAFLNLTQARFFPLLEVGSLSGASGLFKIEASEYWNTHYIFDKATGIKPKIIGPTCSKLLVINGLAPFLFFYGREKGVYAICESVLDFLEESDGESNICIDQWKKAGLPASNALQTQALLQLKQFYCDKKRCLDCRIGNRLLAGME
jgi:hypothetical protein